MSDSGDVDHVHRLYRVTAALGTAVTRAQMAEAVLRELVASSGARAGSALFLSEDGRFVEVEGEVEGELVGPHFAVDAIVPLAEALRTGRPVWLDSPVIPSGAGGRYQVTPPEAGATALPDAFAKPPLAFLPLLIDHRPIGALWLSFDSTAAFAAADREFAAAVANVSAVAFDRVRLYTLFQRAAGARDAFLALAAHELRTPITSLRGFAQLLLRQLRRNGQVSPQQLESALQRIEEQSGRLARLVSQLLDATGSDASPPLLERRLVDVPDLVRRAVGVSRGTANRNHIVVHAPERLEAHLDPIRFEQVLSHLLTNALQATPIGGTVDVELSASPEGQLRLTVSDSGLGVAAEYQSHLFDRFSPAGPNGAVSSGLGLGLYLSRQIVEAHGGTIVADFPPQGGTRISVTLPADPRRTRSVG